MQLSTLKLYRFRRFKEKTIKFHPKLTFIQGNNGSGKTAILEAIYMLFYGRSFRSSQLKHLVQFEHTDLIVTLQAEKEAGSQFLAMQKSLQGDTVLKENQQAIASHLQLASQLPVNVLYPEMTPFILNERKYRRRLLDWGLFYLEPEFISLWQKYQRLLKQRKVLLQQKKFKELTVWNKALAETGEHIDQLRLSYVQRLKACLDKVMADFLTQHKISLTYLRGWSKDETLIESLEKHSAQDMELGYTSVGPHRADLSLRVFKANAKQLLSRGQQKSLVWGIKMAQNLSLIEAGWRPLTLIDDLAAELDLPHQQKLLDFLMSQPGQLVLTGIEATPVIAQFLKSAGQSVQLIES